MRVPASRVASGAARAVHQQTPCRLLRALPPQEGAELATTLERVQAIAAERLGVDPEQVVESAEFIGDLNADSLDLVEVIMAMEQEFDVEIKDEDAEAIRTVGDAVKYIDEHAQS
jgi:acyl carrier protein